MSVDSAIGNDNTYRSEADYPRTSFQDSEFRLNNSFYTEPDPQSPVDDDYTSTFNTDQYFSSRKEAIQWVKEVGINNNMCIVIGRDVSSSLLKRGKTWLHCERHGKPKDGVKTKKNNCPFTLLCRERKRESWTVEVLHGTHNHDISSNLYGHALVGRLNQETFQIVKSLTETNSSPNQIVATLNKLPQNFTTKKQIYTARYNIRKSAREGRTVCQDFFYKAQELNYFVQYREDQEIDPLKDLFFASPDSITLLKLFPYVLIMDSTYATNK